MHLPKGNIPSIGGSLLSCESSATRKKIKKEGFLKCQKQAKELCEYFSIPKHKGNVEKLRGNLVWYCYQRFIKRCPSTKALIKLVTNGEIDI